MESQTLNVSRNGIFVRDVAQAENSLVRLRLYVPPDQYKIEIFGRVAWKGEVGGMKGAGIHFLNLDSADRDHWITFVAQVENLDHAGEPSKPTLGTSAERRTAPRHKASYMVRFRSPERLQDFITTNLSSGGMFLGTPVLKNLGDRVQVVLVHPDQDKDFELEAEVVRINDTPSEAEAKGMALKFLELSTERKEALDLFLKPASA